ncbi:MAG: nuclear transport factor 2 family protein [Polyangiales bacterium]
MISNQDAKRFAAEWIAAWNSHDVEKILAHYEDDLEYYSPMIPRVTGQTSACLCGKPAVRAYVTEALRRSPGLEFTLLHAFSGVTSVTLHYLNMNGRRAAEVFELSEEGKAHRVLCHYEHSG